jgi:HAD superfamily hydrolase (TIGR01549 family)
MTDAALLDLDGTLVDTNYHHALAWYRAFRRFDIHVPVWRLHRHVGMGGDQFVAAVSDDDVEERLGDDLREAEGEEYKRLIDETVPLEGARELVEDLKGLGLTVVLATSAKPDELDHYLDLLDVRELADAWTGADDVEKTKPHPDLVLAAMEKAGSKDAVMLGDTNWDCEAAARAGIRTVALMTGGFSEAELTEAGADQVFHSLQDLRARLRDTIFAR